MGNILDNYKKQLEEDKARKEMEFEMPDFDDEMMKDVSIGVDKDAVAQRVKELENDPNDMEVIYNKFKQEYPRTTEYELNNKGLIKLDDDVTVRVKRAYCPVCGKEIISKVPIMYNPFTLETVAKYECECGAKFNFEHSYPRIVYLNSKGEEIKAFAD